jgi:hypothetical protein
MRKEGFLQRRAVGHVEVQPGGSQVEHVRPEVHSLGARHSAADFGLAGTMQLEM